MFEVPVFKQSPAYSGSAVSAASAGMDGFALYAALRDGQIAAGGSGNKLVSWPWDPRLYPTPPIAMSIQRVMLRPQLVKGGLTIHGVAWVQPTNGNYTANNNNKIGAYTFDGANFTRVAQCASDGTLWQSGTGYRTKLFTTAYTPAADMLLWAAGIYSSSAAVTPPAITMAQGIADAGAKNLGLANWALAVDVTAGPPTDLAASIAIASIDTTNFNNHWLAFFHTY